MTPSKTFLTGDALTVLADISSPFIASTITSPPYLGKLDYQHEAQIGLETTVDSYLLALIEIFREVYRLTLPGGSLIINMGQTYNNYSPVRKRLKEAKQTTFQTDLRRKLYPGYREKECIDPSITIDAMRHIGWIHRDTFIWDKLTPARPSKSDRPRSQHEYLYYFRKPTPGKRYQALYWDDSALPSSIIKTPVVSHPVHPCPFPEGLVKPLILATTKPGMTLLDPFGGIGTVADTAYNLGRRAISIDLKPYRQIA